MPAPTVSKIRKKTGHIHGVKLPNWLNNEVQFQGMQISKIRRCIDFSVYLPVSIFIVETRHALSLSDNHCKHRCSKSIFRAHDLK